LIPVEERDAEKLRVRYVVKGGPAERNERDEEEEQNWMKFPL
jgi:hypothetical protein